jgi:hypothetical protein
MVTNRDTVKEAKRAADTVLKLRLDGVFEFALKALRETFTPTPPRLAHYTHLDAFRQIVEKSTLFASNIRFLNDRQEMEYGLGEATKFLDTTIEEDDGSKRKKAVLRAVKNKLAKSIPQAYACCFCEDSDSLGQWRGYTNNTQGVAIEFDSTELTHHFDAVNSTLQKVIYGEGETRSMLRNHLKSALVDLDGQFEELLGVDDAEAAESIKSLLLGLAPRFKHKSFKDEQEWRMLVTKPTDLQNIQFRTRDNVLVPYIILGDVKKPLPIKRIVIGPGKDMDITLQSVKGFMDRQWQYKNVEIEKSSVPFRT